MNICCCLRLKSEQIWNYLENVDSTDILGYMDTLFICKSLISKILDKLSPLEGQRPECRQKCSQPASADKKCSQDKCKKKLLTIMICILLTIIVNVVLTIMICILLTIIVYVALTIMICILLTIIVYVVLTIIICMITIIVYVVLTIMICVLLLYG